MSANATGQSLRDMARNALVTQLAAHSGNRAALAAQLGISERSLYRKLKALESIKPTPE
jgi:transcriptional regulator with PAS, ATPase and Fis domain